MANGHFSLDGEGIDQASLGSKTSSAFATLLFKNQLVITTTYN